MTIQETRQALQKGLVIPACPLALTRERRFDERHERALFRYYIAAGAGGLAVGVHTTQFAIHDPQVGLYKPILELAAETVQEKGKPIVKIAGLVGKTPQAIREAEIAASLGYEAGLLSLGAFRDAEEKEILEHCQTVAELIPLVGFYLQPAVGGRILSYSFWRRFVEIEQVVAIKIAPFNRYQTLDVIRAVADAGRTQEIALYTGNDDNIVIDLLTEFRFSANPEAPSLRIVGGLLGHWAVWTKRAVELLERIHKERQKPYTSSELLTIAAQVTDCNAALFDVAHQFAGCIAGIHEVLARQGLMTGRWCLDPQEDLSPGQKEEIDRVYASYPHLTDDDFVAEHLDEWLS
ncbi:MAG: dihydrodipicolinate synthase family protein [Anaerolineae bacterium]|nr:dihydrodipicolinate synthase family protein [Anaerolineae bacterium]